MAVGAHYQTLADRGRALVDEMIADASALPAQTTSHSFIADFELFRLAIADRPEATLLDAALTEYQFALYALSIGSYRHAFTSLRLSMELLLGSVYFSAHEIKFRKWTAKSEDIVWSAIIDKENGVFANNFIGAFFTDLRTEGSAYRVTAEKVHRECSEYVHGNYHTHRESDLGRTYDPTVFLEWHDRAKTVRSVFIFAFSARYLTLLPRATVNGLEALIVEAMGSLEQIRDLYDAPGGPID